MQAVLEIVLPVFGVMLFGYGASHWKVWPENGSQILSTFAMNFAVPILLFRSMVLSDPAPQSAAGLLIAVYSVVFAMFLLGIALAWATGRAAAEARAIFGFATGFGNTVQLGIPLAFLAFGQAASFPYFLLLSIHLPFFLILVPSAICLFNRQSLAHLPLSILRSLLINPVIWGLAIGIVWNRLGLGWPIILDRWTELIADAAIGTVLFAAGASLRQYRIAGALAPALAMVGLKNLLMPALVAVAAFWVIPLPPLWAKVAILYAAMPVGVIPYLYANHYKAAQAEVASAIVLSTLASLITIPILLTWLGVTP